MKSKNENTSPEDELQFIGEALREAGEWNLEAEVIQSALHYMSDNPGANVIDAMQVGLMEWIK